MGRDNAKNQANYRKRLKQFNEDKERLYRGLIVNLATNAWAGDPQTFADILGMDWQGDLPDELTEEMAFKELDRLVQQLRSHGDDKSTV